MPARQQLGLNYAWRKRNPNGHGSDRETSVPQWAQPWGYVPNITVLSAATVLIPADVCMRGAVPLANHHPDTLPLPIIAKPDATPLSAIGSSLVIREWDDSGPSYMHIHRSDDEAFHVLEGTLRFRFPEGEVDASAGTTVFVPAGTAHTYRVLGRSRYLIVLTPKLDLLIQRLRALQDPSQLQATLEEFDTFAVE